MGVITIPATPRNESAVRSVIVIGTSTGGPTALTQVLEQLPVLQGTSVCVVQHMPAGFTTNLAKRLGQVSRWSVCEAEDKMTLRAGWVYIAPGGFQTTLETSDEGPTLRVRASGQVNGHQPSVDVLFHSTAEQFHGDKVGVIMTGMGKDGAVGLRALRERGAYTIAESEQTCVVYGMPRAAVSLDAAMEIAPLTRIHTAIVSAFQNRATAPFDNAAAKGVL